MGMQLQKYQKISEKYSLNASSADICIALTILRIFQLPIQNSWQTMAPDTT